MAFCTWDEERYGTGIDRVDEQHRRLFDLLNELHDALERKDDDRIGSLLCTIERETEAHFSDEESFMEECGYATDCSECFRNHRETHTDFASWVTEIRTQYERGQPIQPSVLEFFRDWMDAHIAGEDQDQDIGTYCDSA